MSESVTSSAQGGSSVVRAGEPTGGGRPFRGPETVINPERRPGGPQIAAPAASGSTFRSGIVRNLFPPEEEGGDVAALLEVQLGHFSIVERIRSGGMGAVFRAMDLRLHREVALKVLPPALSRDPLIVQRFRNEAQAAAQLDHENIARVYYVGDEQDLHFIAFEFVSGTNVRELILQQGRLPVGDAVNIALQISSALVHTSAKGVVHRDIKPSNIIVTPDGRAKLVDLGLARKESQNDEAGDLTMAGTTLGTFDYISPEQARDPRTVDVRSDIYSLGCTLYNMLTGEPPYPEGTVLQKLLQHQGDDAPDPAEKNPSVPENLSAIVRKMMAKDPRRRYQTAEQLIRDMYLVAGAMGLRSTSPEGLIWLSSDGKRAPFIERHAAWIGTVATLLLIVGYLEYGGHGNAARLTPGPGTTASPAPDGEPSPNTGVAPSAPSERMGDDQGSDRSQIERTRTKTALGAGGTTPGSMEEPRAAQSNQGDNPTGVPFSPIPLTVDTGEDREGSFSLGPAPDTPAVARAAEQRAKARVGGTPVGVESAKSIEDEVDAGGLRRPAGNAATTGAARTGAGDRNPDVDIPSPAINEEEGIVLLGRDGGPDQKFTTLEAACSAIRNDGAVVELRFDGRRIETNLKVTRKVTIRAAKGRRPVIEFHPRRVVTDGGQVRAISLPSGWMHLVGVELILFVEEGVSADQWNLFSIERPDSLRLEGVTATIVNPRLYPAAMIELRTGPGAMMPDMPIVGAQPRPPLEIELGDSLFRGQCDLISVRHAEPARLTLRQCLVAVQGSLLAVRGGMEAPPENGQLELKLEHVTAALGGGLIRMDSGNIPRKLPSVQVFAFDSIFSSAGGLRGADLPALVSMTGSSPFQDFRKLLAWNGRNNVYDRFQTYLSIVSTEGTGRSDTWDFSAWKNTWNDAAEANASAVEDGLWRRPWISKPFADLMAADFTLDRHPRNRAVSGATNARDAGADLARIPRPAAPAIDDAPADRQRD